jgi:hypothetical protein
MRKTGSNFFADATIDKLLFHAAKFRKLGKDPDASERGYNIGGVADGGIRREPRKTIGPTALQSEREF